ncbi:uncharacterized protein LOC114539457 [Dendronephthya gigantea]|uniref:uncharacterized protein LOC114539457 n=1 Tax=Dendronephthya gigantea TaxID=151771 RepID=UPI00106C47A6|nr:uncharacterized protein LOC114539457 [Dendronephthya gigantea]
MRKGYFFLSCIKGNTRENKRGAERQANAVNEYASACEISLYDIPSEHDSLNCQSNDGPVYDVLEGPGDKQNTDQSQNVYASVNDGCVEEEDPVDPISRSGNFEVSFLEEIYSTLAEDRGNDAGNIYESLRRDQNENEKNDGWSVEGMKSCDQDYVSVVNE